MTKANATKIVLNAIAANIKVANELTHEPFYHFTDRVRHAFTKPTPDCNYMKILNFFKDKPLSTHLDMLEALYPTHTRYITAPYYGYNRDTIRDMVYAGLLGEMPRAKVTARKQYFVTDLGKAFISLVMA